MRKIISLELSNDRLETAYRSTPSPSTRLTLRWLNGDYVPLFHTSPVVMKDPCLSSPLILCEDRKAATIYIRMLEKQNGINHLHYLRPLLSKPTFVGLAVFTESALRTEKSIIEAIKAIKQGHDRMVIRPFGECEGISRVVNRAFNSQGQALLTLGSLVGFGYAAMKASQTYPRATLHIQESIKSPLTVVCTGYLLFRTLLTSPQTKSTITELLNDVNNNQVFDACNSNSTIDDLTPLTWKDVHSDSPTEDMLKSVLTMCLAYVFSGLCAYSIDKVVEHHFLRQVRPEETIPERKNEEV